MPATFLYFDLGNVLLLFDHHLAARQMAEVAGITVSVAWRVVFEDGLEAACESGEITSRQFHERFCEATHSRPDFHALMHASNEIFTVNAPMKALVAALMSAGHRVGLLSNISQAHWQYVSDGRYAMIPRAFDALALSYEIGAMKPSGTIFHAAAELAGVTPERIFYTDDTAGHVAGAQDAGYDAVQFTTVAQCAADLRSRGVRFNY